VPDGSVPFGEVIAERSFAVFGPDGAPVALTVRLGKPFRDPAVGHYRCPLHVSGGGYDKLTSAWGEDPFVALQYAIDLAGQLLDRLIEREQLQIRHTPPIGRDSWIWKYPPHRPS
jgi:hypothetical protein